MIIRNRKHLEELERRELASYASLSAESAGREHDEPPPETRTRFQRDWNRVTHTKAFRKLEYKTQVMTFGEGTDFSRNRLTHTLEVEQIASSIARSLGLNVDLTRTIALAHDLGHTPFGHAGEIELRELTNSFNHNRHSLKIVRRLERRYPQFDGLNLTLEALEGMEKHETEYDRVESHVFYPGLMPSMESQVVNVADVIAYRCHDLDDAIHTRIILKEQLDRSDLVLWEKVRDRVEKCSDEVWRAQVIRHLINLMILDVLRRTSDNISTMGIKSIEDARQADDFVVKFSDETDIEQQRLGDFLYSQYYRDYRIVRMTNKGRLIINRLFREYESHPEILHREVSERIRNAKGGIDEIREIIADHIAGMTDRYAINEYRRLFDVTERIQSLT